MDGRPDGRAMLLSSVRRKGLERSRHTVNLEGWGKGGQVRKKSREVVAVAAAAAATATPQRIPGYRRGRAWVFLPVHLKR